MSWLSNKKEKKGALIKKNPVPAEVHSDLQPQQDQATRLWFQILWDKFRGLTEDDALRLKEAALKKFEGQAAKEVSDARRLDSEATLNHAKAEKERQEAAQIELKNRQKSSELEKQSKEADAEQIERIADAAQRLADAISRIRQEGGDVQFVFEKLGVPSGQLEEPRTNPGESTTESLSEKAASEMIRRRDFYDREKNPSGKGVEHTYELIDALGGVIVFDKASGLTWQKSGSPKDMTFASAEEHVQGLNRDKYAGFSDWRLPTLEEAMSLMEPTKNESLFIDALFDRRQPWIWTSVKEGDWQAWFVDFRDGGCGQGDVDHGIPNYVRAVR